MQGPIAFFKIGFGFWEKFRPDQTTPHQTRPDKTKQDQTRKDQTRKDQTSPDKTKPDQTKPDQNRPDKTRQYQKRPNKPRPDQTKQDHNISMQGQKIFLDKGPQYCYAWATAAPCRSHNIAMQGPGYSCPGATVCIPMQGLKLSCA